MKPFRLETASVLTKPQAVLLFGLGCATRSNGVISCRFVIHQIIKHFISNEVDSLKSTARLLTLLNLCNAVKASLKLVIFNGFILAPFIFFQLYGYVLHCKPLADVTRQGAPRVACFGQAWDNLEHRGVFGLDICAISQKHGCQVFGFARIQAKPVSQNLGGAPSRLAWV